MLLIVEKMLMNNFIKILFIIAGISVAYSVLHNAIQQPDSKCQLFPTDKNDEFIFSCSPGNQEQRVHLKNWHKGVVKNKLYCPPEPFFSIYLLDENDELHLCKQKTIGYPLELWCEKSFTSFFNIDCDDAYSKEKHIASFQEITKNPITFTSPSDPVKQERIVHHSEYGHIYHQNIKWFDYMPNFYIIASIFFAFLLGVILSFCGVITWLFCKISQFSQMRKYTENLYAPTTNGTDITTRDTLLNNIVKV